MMPKLMLVAVAALLGAACQTKPADQAVTVAADTCAIERPVFTPATAAERSLFAYDTAAPLNLTVEVESTVNDIETRAIEYDSPAGGRVRGMMWVPVTRSSLRPGLIVMHGMPGTARGEAGQARVFAEHGAVVIAIDAPFNRRTGSPFTVGPQDRAEQIQLIMDLQRAVDVLRGQVNVDPARIGYRGLSYGGAIGALFAGVERRVQTFILMVPDGGLVSHFTGPEDQHGILVQVSCQARVSWFRDMAPVEPIRFVGLAAPASLLIQSGELDELVPPADARLVHDAASMPKSLRWYRAGHFLTPEAIHDQLDWLHEQIGTDARR